ncbi:MAG: hypothetical protein A2W80_12080 [Candidatus Riflebacteria bacterium GWC2_50_8]|nr:MAG: hypothetical protein A2W80_12080 [Candidatus Riflebacteria bacterium GWC2_50_8]
MHKAPARSVSIFALMLFLVASALSPVAAKPFAVHYTIKGIVQITEGIPCLYTADGRLFHLLMDKEEARKFNGKAVGVEGKVAKSDEVENVKVKKIEVLEEDDSIQIPEVEHEAYQRPAKMLGEANGKMTVGNIRWDISPDPASEKKKALHSWENATINPNKVLKAYFLVKPFAPKFLAAHTLLGFSFEPGGVVAKDGRETDNIFLTIEAYKKIGQTYGLIKTMKKNFDIVWILTTLHNYADLNVNYNNDTDKEIIIYPINLTREQTRALLVETIKQSCVNRQGEYYHTIRNNCTNNLIILLNRVLTADKRIKLWKIPSMLYNLKATMPVSVVKMLKKKGLIGEAALTITKENFVTSFDRIK